MAMTKLEREIFNQLAKYEGLRGLSMSDRDIFLADREADFRMDFCGQCRFVDLKNSDATTNLWVGSRHYFTDVNVIAALAEQKAKAQILVFGEGMYEDRRRYEQYKLMAAARKAGGEIVSWDVFHGSPAESYLFNIFLMYHDGFSDLKDTLRFCAEGFAITLHPYWTEYAIPWVSTYLQKRESGAAYELQESV